MLKLELLSYISLPLTEVGVVLRLRALLGGDQVQSVPQVLGVGLPLPVVAAWTPDKQSLL